MSTALQAHFADYGAYHRTPGNRACHMIGIPLIVLTVFAFLAQVPLFAVQGYVVTLAEVLIAGCLLYYATLDARLAALMALVSVVLLFVARRMPWPVALGLFVAGWVLQYVGRSE